MEEIEYLYHYTSIENLALILKNRTIRLNPLDKMDDLQEQRSAEIRDFGKFTFVSCWTSDEVESIPMWKLYTQLTSGVRIKMRTRPFVPYNNVPVKQLREWACKNNGQVVTEDISGFVTYIDANWMISNGVITPHAFGDDILYRIEYTNELEKLEPQIVSDKEGTTYLCGNAMGKHKNEHWAFQKEWRYLLSAYPWPPIREGVQPPPLQYIDLQIAPDCYDDMEITWSPRMTAGNRILLETLLEKYNPKAIIKKRQLLGKIGGNDHVQLQIPTL